MKKILLATLAILWLLTGIGGKLVAQENIAVWKFPSNNTAVTCVSDGISESDCSFSAVGNVNTSGTNNPNTLLCDGTDDTKSLQVLGQDGGSVIFKISTLPYRNIVVSYDLRCHPSLGGNPNYAWSYSFDGVSYTNAPASTSVTNFTATTFTTQTADFSSITAMNGKQSVWFKLTMSGATSNVTSNLDNVVFTGIPFTCMAPVNVVAAQNDAVDEAVVSWEPAGTNETSYTVVYYTGAVNQSALSSMASANYNTVANATSPQTITGLEANTTYYIYVRANCDGNDESMWSQAALVTTPRRCTIADLSVSNIGGTTATLSWNTEAAGAKVRVFSAPTETPWETSTGLVFEQSVADTFCNVTGMQYSTNYYAYVRSACTERNLSEPISTTFTTAFADNVIEATIGNGTSTNYTSPFNNLYKISWNQSIYTVAEIGHAGTIGSIAYYSTSSSTVHYSDLRIYMGLTANSIANSTSDWVPMDDLTLVYSSTDYTAGGQIGWETFFLDTPFEYDGSANLAIVVVKNTLPDTYNSSVKYQYTTVSNRVLYRQSDSNTSYASHPETNTGTRSSELPNIKIGLGNPYNVCLPVSAMVATNKTDAGFTASWTRGGEETAWIVKYGEAGFDVESEGTLQNVTDTFCVISGLNASTAYDVYVKASCDAQHTSGWSLATFTTECGAESVPYSETFENVTGSYVIPECWERVISYTSGSSLYPYVYSSNAHNGSKCLYMYIPSSTTASENIIALPPVDDINTLKVSLWAKYSSNVPQAFEIGYMRNGEFTAVKSITLTTTYQQYTAYMSQAPADADKIAIRAYHASTYVYVYVDDIEVDVIPSCVAPDAIEASDVTTTSASISWTDVLPATAWQYQLNNGDVIDLDSKPINLTGLASSTEYTIKVRTVCGENEYSDWSTATIWTACGVISDLPWSENFNSLTAGIPNCWDNSEGSTTNDSYKWNYYSTGHEGVGLRFDSYVNSSGYTNMLKTPVFDLSAITGAKLEFWYKNPAGGDFSVYVSTDGGTTYTSNVVATGLTGVSAWTKYTYDLDSYCGNGFDNVVVVFKGTSNYGYDDAYIYLDDVSIREISSAAEITAFSFAQDVQAAVISSEAASVNSTVSFSTANLNGLVPTIAVSDYATISPASGVARDFSSPVTYTVTAEDGTTKDWTVTVTKETVASSAKDILSFSFANQIGESVIDPDNHTVSAQIVWDYDLADNITPAITVSPQATISPASGTAQNFTNPVTYTVTAEDASTQTWTVTIITDPSVCVNPLASTFTAAELSSTSATIAWVQRYQETSYNVKVSTTAMTDMTATADVFDGVVNDTAVALTSLVENTQYYMYVQSTCGAEGWTDYTFRTIVEPATIPYICGFEESAENNQWILINGTQTNKWYIGTASNNGGENGLYVSNDNGTSNVYDNGVISYVYAYRTVNFPANSDYIVSFDWKANGESDYYDYIRAWIVPASFAFTPGQLPNGVSNLYDFYSVTPEGWISLDENSSMNQVTTWQNKSQSLSVPAGLYNVVFLWANDGSGGSQPPASIDNISVTQITCPTVANITATATQNTADIAWTERGNATEWAVVVSNAELTEEQLETAEKHIVDTASYQATGLNSNTTYYIYVRANCSTEDVSDWRMKQIRTDCGANVLPYSENFDEYTATAYDEEGTVPYCWNVVFSGSDEGFAPHVTNTDYYQPNTGSKYLVMSVAQNEAEGTDAYALLPELVNGYANTNVSFEYRAGATNRGTFSLGYMVGETYTNLTDITLGSTSKVSFSYSVPSTVPANAILALKLTAAGAANLSLGIDNVYIRETSSAAEITAFSFAQDAEDAEIISESATVNSTVSFSTESLEALVPTILISEYATIEPASGVARDFSAPVTYTVTAEDGTIKEWTVNVTKQTVASSAKDILSFSFSGQRGESVIDPENHTVTAYTEWNYNFSNNIIPTITVSPLATISPASGTAQNFAAPFTYTVMAEDSTTQDWIVTLAHDPNQCVNPLATSMVVRDLTSSSATVAWVKRYDANETSFNVKVSTTAMTDMTATADFFDGVVNDTAIVLTGLTDATTYYVYVQTACGIEAWINKSFTTPCVVVTSLPWSENFDGLSVANSIPNCWDNSEGTTTTDSYRWCYNTSTSGNGATNGTGHSGNCIRFNSWTNSTGNTNMLKTPAFDLSSYVGASLTFWYKNPTGGDFSVYISTDGGATYTNNRLATGLTGTSTWTEMTYDITSYSGNNVVIVFKGTSNYGSNDAYIYLDDVSIDVVTCPAVSAIEASNQTPTEATIGWTENGTATNWQIVVSEDALADPATGTINNVATTSYSLTTLTPETDYNVYVRAKCADDDFSDWVPFTLSTPALCPIPTNLQVPEATITTNSATVTWNGYHATAWDVVYSATSLTDPATGDIVTVDVASYNMASLSPATMYYVYVRANCGGDEFSAWANYSFRTPCGDVTSFPWTEDFENGVDCWTMVDADDDGYGWVAGSAVDGIYLDGGDFTGSGHNSSADMLVSGSFSNVSLGALTPDNWAISPALDLTQMNENEPLKLTYFVKASDASYSEEHYKVCVSTTTSAISSFTTTLIDEILEEGNNEWQERNIDLSSYSGQRIYLAFVHYDVTDQFLILIDDITVTQPSGENDIITFSVPDMLTVDIDNTSHRVAAEISNSSTQDLSAIVPTITVSDYAEITLVNGSDYTEGVAQDFTSPVVYTVKAENNSTQDWIVIVTRAAAPSSEKDILAFSFAGQVGESVIDPTAHSITAVARWNMNLDEPISPTIEISPLATISPASGAARTFAEPVVYTVTAEDATTMDWTVTISLAQLDVASVPFECDFENASENGNWVFENEGQTNQWHIGTAANNGGANGLYISDNNGVSYNYNTSNESYVYAYRQINFADAGHYDISFDWKARGESGCYDAMYAALVPQGTTCPPASNIISYNNTLPTGYINVADVSQSYSSTGEFLWTYNESDWITSTKNIEITESGDYTLVFYWKNDGSGGTNPPAAVDNISIARSVFTVTASHTGLGTISPEGEIPANDGEEIQFSVTPMDGFIVSTLMVDGVDHSEEIVDGVYTLTVQGNHNVVANFDVPHTILASAGVGGTITPEGLVQVGNGESKTFAVASNVGYIISSVIADTTELISEGQELVNFSYTFNNVRDDHTITAAFELAPSHTITATASEGGTITPNGAVDVLYNGSQTFEFTPNEGYRLSRVMVDTTSNVTTFVENNTYTFNNVIANHSINAEFVANSYNLTVHYVYADNTTAAPDHTESVTFGTTYSVTSPVITGYTADQLVVEGTMPANNVELTVIYNVNSYNLIIHYVYADNTTASPDHTEEVAFGTAYSVTSPVIANYTADQLVVEGTMPAEDVVVTVTYNVNNYNLTIHYVYAENNAEAAPDHTEEVAYGAQYSVVSPVINGYTADQLTVAGTMPAEDVVVTVRYTANPPETYTLTIHYVYATNNATVAPDHIETLEEGASYSVTSPVIDGYTADQLTVEGTMPANDVNVTVRYTENGTTPTTYTITATAGNGGAINPNGTVTVNEGADKAFTITADAGYRIASVLVDNADATSQLVDGVYTFTNVRANHTIAATFEPASSTTYTITASAGNGGTITPNNVVTVAEGANQTFRFTPDNGYRIATVVVDGNNAIDEVVDYSYTFYDVRANHTIYVTFTDGDAVDEYTAGSMSIYPNPNNGMFSIDFSRIEGDATYQLIDARGAVVETRDINVMDGDTLNFNHDLRPGTYFVRIVTADKVYVEQIVVE